MSRRRWYALACVSAAMLVLRVVWVIAFREIDSDAYGHYFIALAARRDPGNLAVHWVWLPLYHLVVGALSSVGLTFRGLRFVNAVVATAGPFLLAAALAAVRRRPGGPRADDVGRSGGTWAEDPVLLAAVAFAIAPLTTVLGQSAQPETLFSILVVASFFEAASDRPVRGGLALGAACFVRYEAWGGALALSVAWLVAKARRRSSGPPLALAAIPAGLVLAYVLLRWWTDGHLLLFVRGTREITAVQVARHAWTFREIVSFPVVLPFLVMGPALALVPFGLRRALGHARDGTVPAGYAAFLLLSYYGGGAHSGERYLVALVPFACAAIGAGAVRVGRRLGRPTLVALLTLGLVGATTVWHLRRAATMAISWEPGLRERENVLERVRRGEAAPDAL